MSTQFDALLRQALHLPEEERELLAGHLIGSLTRDDGYEEAWEKEIDRRLAEVESGIVKPIPLEEALKLLRADLK